MQKDDLISRQDAIEIIQSMYPGMPRVPWMRRDWQKRYKPYIRIEEAIKELSSAQPEQRWIPCTPDRMPSENDAYIVTCVGEGTKWTDVAEYSKRHKGWRYGLHSDDIIAWMPLPKPWREENQ